MAFEATNKLTGLPPVPNMRFEQTAGLPPKVYEKQQQKRNWLLPALGLGTIGVGAVIAFGPELLESIQNLGEEAVEEAENILVNESGWDAAQMEGYLMLPEGAVLDGTSTIVINDPAEGLVDYLTDLPDSFLDADGNFVFSLSDAGDGLVGIDLLETEGNAASTGSYIGVYNAETNTLTLTPVIGE